MLGSTSSTQAPSRSAAATALAWATAQPVAEGSVPGNGRRELVEADFGASGRHVFMVAFTSRRSEIREHRCRAWILCAVTQIPIAFCRSLIKPQKCRARERASAFEQI
jgi:hypothetical protein